MKGLHSRLLLVTHGDVGSAMLATVEKILGPQKDVIAVSNTGLSTRGLVKLVQETLRSDSVATLCKCLFV